MRCVAQELTVGTMSLYYYVRTKDDLVSVMDDALMSEAVLSEVPRNWKQAITEMPRGHTRSFPSSLGAHLDAVRSSWSECDAAHGAVP